MNKRISGILLYLMLIGLVLFGFRILTPPQEVVDKVSATKFVQALEKNEVTDIHYDDSKVTYKLKDGKPYMTYLPKESRVNIYETYIAPKVSEGKINISQEPIKVTPFYVEWIPTIVILLVFIAAWYYMMNQTQGGGGSKMGNFGKSRARMIKPDDKKIVTFNEVAGLVEEKEELSEIVDFLKSPKKFMEMGARIPKGVLMVGPPGTGKTYLSRAVAGEAKVPFFIMSGSDFVEMFVGVGASRVRDLFESAKKNAPCIIFIDEIDAVGRRRGAGVGGGHDEREQTLNQLLVEMDGFGENEGVIVMAATNRSDILDPALMRPGRFDRTVYVGRPDIRGREQILEIHSRNKKMAEDVDLKTIAKRTPGFTPADLENLMNEAALLAARRGETRISMEDVDEASIKVQAGPAKKSKVVTEKERKLTAVHEAGHAVASVSLNNTDPVDMITIIPRGMAGGFTSYLPEEEITFMTKGQMEDKIVTLLGGRVAEDLVLDDISTGAHNDIQRATQLARDMVTEYGMSEKIGTINLSTDEGEVFIGKDLGRSRNYSEQTAYAIDQEVKRMVDEAYTKCRTILSENMDKLLKVSDTLLEKETIGRSEFERIIRGEQEPVEGEVHIEKSDLSEEAKQIVEDIDK
ncbi:cell division protease FtsH [Peptoniphilus asaccharolyticus DSM 20463]|uniref:ATP-dependent zinc metalloprotease FtsH n=1 Tax=Peptoniphilus asaccharolyticus DSM 20463 TaxID=573058 RepID=A0A1W1UKF3_PEPAS|nr:ATP-dependent zinc metalloprotease FtsH [Peptoniphilus asaccharolyticus]MBL7574810.1 ATP-dependent zinc metalloprotease FtsH [Peptoniphilus asaccharolyticus]SMB81271.1 cell division protease FtsH [Peptoniphilus asaccharolyticus DSM 20463]